MEKLLVTTLLSWLESFKFPLLCRKIGIKVPDLFAKSQTDGFNCRVQLTRQQKNGSVADVLSVEICGSIHAPDNGHYTTVRILVTDITDGFSTPEPVHSSVKKWQQPDSQNFCYNADLGKLPHEENTLANWLTVAKLHGDWLKLPHKGKRILKFSTSILSAVGGRELASGNCTFTYENSTFAHIDPQENIKRTKTLAVALAFAVSAADNKLYDCEVELIKNWARNNVALSKTTKKERRRLEKALKETVVFFRNGNQINCYNICKEVVEIAPVADRYDILGLCIKVAAANGTATVEELNLLKNLAHWLEIDTNRFRQMMEKILPADMHQIEDLEVVLGVTSDMSKKQTRRHLNNEYRKWNSRVTNLNPKIQSQADYMLRFIAEARRAYAG